MKRSARLLPDWIAALPAALLFGSVVLRVTIENRGRPELAPVLGILCLWLLLLVVEPAISRRWPRFFLVYLALQAPPPLFLIASPLGDADYFAVLFGILSMQAMLRLPVRQGAACIGLLTFLLAFPLARIFSPAAAAGYTLIYLAANAVLGSYTLANRRAREAHAQSERLVLELEEANRRLREAASQREQLAIARARHQLARELHDSVTQTVFSMTLATESALLLLEREPGKVEAQLDHLTELAQAALGQMQTLIAELRPEVVAAGGLEAALRRHLADRHLPGSLAFAVEVEGDGALRPAEERGLFAIAREAVNNTLKHSGATEACIRLHLSEPFWMEVTDNGRGFGSMAGAQHGGVGLVGMREQAAEIGWDFALSSAAGAGTRLRVEREAQERSAE